MPVVSFCYPISSLQILFRHWTSADGLRHGAIDIGAGYNVDFAKIWQAFARLRALETCILKEISCFDSRSYGIIKLSTLTRLDITFASYAAAVDLFQSSVFLSLHKLTLKLSTGSQYPDKAQIRGLSRIVASSCLPKVLTYLELVWDHHGDLDELSAFVTGQALRPFLCLTSLHHFSVKIPELILDADDALVKDMLSSWPHLQHISLNPAPTCLAVECDEWRSHLTFGALDQLATTSPNLQYFGAIFSNNPIPAKNSQPPFSPRSSLKVLDVGESLIEEAHEVAIASYLSGLFLVLEELRTSGADWCSDARRLDRWARVFNLGSEMIKIRQEERERERQQRLHAIP